MKYLNTSIKSLLACLIILALGSSTSLAARGGWGGGGGRTPAPTVSLSASPSTIDEAQSAILSWSSTDANSCSASWTDSSATSGSQSVSPIVTTTYSIICNGDGGSANDSVTVTVNITGGGSDGDYIGGRNDTQVFDTSFAVEFSYSCLSGGCHETNQNLVDEYAASKMTHVMVKCNACHGTHTADTIGMEKPNLTGYYPGIGATGYRVDTDRCKACHNNEHTGYGNKSGDNCYSCHTPHVFGAGGGGGGGGW
ncbi:MAG: hypothetical protein QNL62_18715 [Gammaproteobacteria bacterium]|nr:hypothetical protein [Gammaproteobacteria bacterium]